jgi:hypothetical protein
MKECENHNIIRYALYNHRITIYPYVSGVKYIADNDKTNPNKSETLFKCLVKHFTQIEDAL